jgi:DNA-directed RNA polymerase alpha subunit
VTVMTEVKDISEYLDIPLVELLHEVSLDVRSYNVLVKGVARTLRQLCSLTPREFLRYQNCGRHTVESVSRMLSDYGLSFYPDKCSHCGQALPVREWGELIDFWNSNGWTVKEEKKP